MNTQQFIHWTIKDIWVISSVFFKFCEERGEHSYTSLSVDIQGGTPKNPEFIYKKLCILTCLNLSHLQSILHLLQYTYQDILSTTQNIFELVDFDAF